MNAHAHPFTSLLLPSQRDRLDLVIRNSVGNWKTNACGDGESYLADESAADFLLEVIEKFVARGPGGVSYPTPYISPSDISYYGFALHCVGTDYRLLGPDEVIQVSDEFWAIKGGWEKVGVCSGSTPRKCVYLTVRRERDTEKRALGRIATLEADLKTVTQSRDDARRERDTAEADSRRLLSELETFRNAYQVEPEPFVSDWDDEHFGREHFLKDPTYRVLGQHEALLAGDEETSYGGIWQPCLAAPKPASFRVHTLMSYRRKRAPKFPEPYFTPHASPHRPIPVEAGWRILGLGEITVPGDQIWVNSQGHWVTACPGSYVAANLCSSYRRKL